MVEDILFQKHVAKAKPKMALKPVWVKGTWILSERVFSIIYLSILQSYWLVLWKMFGPLGHCFWFHKWRDFIHLYQE